MEKRPTLHRHVLLGLSAGLGTRGRGATKLSTSGGGHPRPVMTEIMHTELDEMLDFDRLDAAPVSEEPFPYVILPGFVRSESRSAIESDFPTIERAGSFPLASLSFGPVFGRLIEQLSGEQMRAIIAKKFDLDLENKPVMVTVRGMCTARDGHIHTDSTSKLVTFDFALHQPELGMRERPAAPAAFARQSGGLRRGSSCRRRNARRLQEWSAGMARLCAVSRSATRDTGQLGDRRERGVARTGAAPRQRFLQAAVRAGQGPCRSTLRPSATISVAARFTRRCRIRLQPEPCRSSIDRDGLPRSGQLRFTIPMD